MACCHFKSFRAKPSHPVDSVFPTCFNQGVPLYTQRSTKDALLFPFEEQRSKIDHCSVFRTGEAGGVRKPHICGDGAAAWRNFVSRGPGPGPQRSNAWKCWACLVLCSSTRSPSNWRPSTLSTLLGGGFPYSRTPYMTRAPS